MTETLKIVVVGCGGISNLWFKALKGIADVTVVGLVDIQEASALKRKTEHHLDSARIGGDLAAMLQETQPNIVFDCTVPDARATVVQAALKHGCHVLSEKPMAASMSEARQLIKAAKEANRLFAVMQNRRYDPRIQALRSFLDSNALGELTTLNGDFYLGAHFGGFRDKMPHVLLLDMAIHSFDQARFISGADPVAVYCHEWNPRGSWYERDASAIAMFEMSNGIVYTYRGSWCAEGVNTSWECDWRAVGVRGTVTWDGADRFHAQVAEKGESLIRPFKDVPVPAPEAATYDGHTGCIRNFIDCVRTGRIPETICTENIKSLAMVFGAIESAQTGKRIPITL
jgi:predicted dehydrogenase